MGSISKSISDITMVRIVPVFKEFGGGSNVDVMELSKEEDPFIKRQVLIAPYDSGICKDFDNKFDFEIIRIKSPRLKRNFPFITYFINNFSFYLSIYKKIKSLHDVNLILAHEINPIAYSCTIGKLLNIPVVGMMHGTSEAYSVKSGLDETILASLFKPTKAIIVDSGTNAPIKFRQIWGDDRTTIVKHGIDLERFFPREKNVHILHRLNLMDSDLIVLSISALIPIKNIDLAIESFEKTISGNTSTRIFLLIAGDGSETEKLKKLVNEKNLSDRVIFLGSVKIEHMPDLISIADICIGTSLVDNMNRSILEPMACGKPIIAFGGGNIEELITTGYNGFLAKPGDILDFSEKLKLLLNDSELRSLVGKRAQETIKEKRSCNGRVVQDMSVYLEAINVSKK